MTTKKWGTARDAFTGEVAIIRAEIERLEKALRGIQDRIKLWTEEEKKNCVPVVKIQNSGGPKAWREHDFGTRSTVAASGEF